MFSERQQQIVEHAIKIIDEKGIQGLTIKNISKAIGISEPAIYRHFESKTDIILAVLTTLKDAADFFSQLMKHEQGTAADKIGFIFQKMVAMFSENPSLVSVIFAEEIFKNEEVLKTAITDVLNKNEETLEFILKMGQDEGNVRSDIDNKVLALMIMGSLRLMVKRWYMGDFSFELSAEVEHLLETIRLLINPGH
jgi:AcrR family transcriptional regulator